MEALRLYFRGEPLREFVLGRRSLEIGSAPGCDIVIHDPGVAGRELLVRPAGGTVVAYDLRGGGTRRARVLPRGEQVMVGDHHAIVRVDVTEEARPEPGGTESLARPEALGGELVVLVGRGAEARRQTLRGRPVTVGSAPECELVLHDRAVSGRHCRLDPLRDGVLVRDLESRNGTWVDGMRVRAIELAAGAVVRVGRTDLCIARRERHPESRPSLVAASPAMQRVLAEIERYARLSWPVLVLGESGVGKEGLAHALHARGPRAARPFVALNAGGLPAHLVESELFGHEKGAFTGAVGTHRGVFEQADGGTLFLDEIGELPLDLQARLLRVLETGDVRRVGAEGAIRVDVRVVCATHRDLRTMIDEGRFRRDLYYRLCHLSVAVPPLRERPEDVRALAPHFLRLIEDEVGPRELDEAALARLLAHRWEGNARELRNVLAMATAASPARVIEASDVERAIARIGGTGPVLPALEGLRSVLASHAGNVSAAARALGVPRSTLRDRLRSS